MFLLLIVPFLLLLLLLSDSSGTVLVKPRVRVTRLNLGLTVIWGPNRGSPVICGPSRGSTGIWGVTVLSDTLGDVSVALGDVPLVPVGDVPLVPGVPAVVRLLLDNISVMAAMASFNLLPESRNGFAAAGFFNASTNSSNAAVARSVDDVVGMLYFSGRNTTVSDTRVPLVFGM